MPAEIKIATKAIDKLRIQGSAAPRRGPEQVRRTFHHPAFHDADAPSHFVYQADTGSIVNGSEITTIVNSHPSSAASRKHDHLQRVQQANRGLTSAEFGGIGREGLPSIHFLLRGKPVHADGESATLDVLNHQRVGHYKTSAKEVYRARHRINNELSSSGDQTNFFRAIRTPFHDTETSSTLTHTNFSNTGNSFPVNYFYLGPSAPSGPAHNTQWLGRRGELELTSAPAILKRPSQNDSFLPPAHHDHNNNSDYQTWPDNCENSIGDTGQDLSFTGHPHMHNTPRGSPRSRFNGPRYFDGSAAVADLMGSNPTPAHSRQRHTSTWSRRGTRDPPKFKSDHSSLKDCLHVHKSHKIPYKADISPRDIFRLKHCPQTKVNYNNPYRNLRSKDRKGTPGEGRYIFNSVESYIHFNKIYPRATDMQMPNDLSHKGTPSGGLPNIPRVNGFTSHCTDTVLLKMMFEMNKPKSGKSISKYSDVAVHRDLDEFMIVSTPTVSRSPSVASRKTPGGHSKSRSQVSFNSTTRYKEEDEEREDVLDKSEAKADEKEEDEEADQEEVYSPRNDHKDQKDETEDVEDGRKENEIQNEEFQDVETEQVETKEEINAGEKSPDVLDQNGEDGVTQAIDGEKEDDDDVASHASGDDTKLEGDPDAVQTKRPGSAVSEPSSIQKPGSKDPDDE